MMFAITLLTKTSNYQPTPSPRLIRQSGDRAVENYTIMATDQASRNGVTVRLVGETEAKDIFLITGITTEDETGREFKRERRGAYSCEDLLSLIVD